MNLFDYASEGLSEGREHLADGFRLQKLEVYNWGTFDKQIWSFTPGGKTTLLTGESGSGKSTLVDALVTLFVSPRKIAFNKAADASARERSMLSYVCGHYGQKYAAEGRGTPEALRGTNQYSVLLATLCDAQLQQTVTLAAFFWFREQKKNPSRFYVVAREELFIQRDFAGFQGNIKKLRAALKIKGANIFDDYNHYAVCYQKLLGRLTPQAIDLFQQTISMKKVEALTGFVRSSMLEETDIQDDIDKLLEHYYSLNRAYQAVQHARKQIDRLQPICTNGTNYSSKQANLIMLEREQQALENWFASQKAGLYEQRVQQLTQELQTAVGQTAEAQQAFNQLEAEIKRLEKEIFQNGGEALENLEKELQRKEEIFSARKKALAHYANQAVHLKLTNPSYIADFIENQRQMETLAAQLPQQQQQIQTQFSAVSAATEKLTAKKRETDEEISSLRERTSNIPKELIFLRNTLCDALHIPPQSLPFAGELLEVKEDESIWEGAIERLLHSFALSLLVSSEQYSRVAKWVNENHLGTRLVYFAIKPQKKEALLLHPDAVSNKLLVKQGTPFTKWLTKELTLRFSHICCRDLALFQTQKRAITIKGQIKSATRHEKNDHKKLSDPTRYVLGFSNEKKIAVLTQQSIALEKKISSGKQEENAILRQLNHINRKESALSALAQFKDFSEIDVQSIAGEMDSCQQQIRELTDAENNMMAILRQQHNEAKTKKSRQAKLVKQAEQLEFHITEQLKKAKSQQKENHEKLETETPADKEVYSNLAANKSRRIGDQALTLDNSNTLKNKYFQALHKEHRDTSEKISTLQNTIEKEMVRFRQEFPNEMRETDDTVESLTEYHRLLQQLRDDDLPKYEANFKQLLTSRVMQQIAVFQMTLRQQYDGVKKRIADINHSLHGIDYNPRRYIRLNCEDTLDSEIRVFRTQLRACTEGASSGFDDDEMSTMRFLQIKEIIERFQGREKETENDKKWTKKVTDVRNWFVFSASERWRENDEEYEHYTDSGGKSGGQKEKLAYTILAASLVYNYGLHQDYVDESSFRLVVIDEAFLKSSDDSAKFGLQLFQKLQFQLLIVTPLLKISTIEPFISHVGFVSHDDVEHRSALVNIPIEVYQEKRKVWEAQYLDQVDG